MKLPWKKKHIEPTVTKSASAPGASHSSFVGWLQRNDNWNLSFAMLLQYYERCAPFGSAVNEIADAGAEIVPRVWSKRKGAYIDGHPILDFIENPNGDMGREEFIGHCLMMFLVTGNLFPEIIGYVGKPPLSIDVSSPSIVEIEPDRAGDAGTIMVNSEFGARQYTQEIVKGRTIFSMNGDREIVHIKGYNPKRGTRQYFASPIARPLYYDIEQYIQGGLHNKSLLEKGARPSGILTTKNDEWMPDDVYTRLEQQLKTFLQGAGNAGEVMIGENSDFRELSTTNKDMDYKTLIENATLAIYRQFKIPLPLVSSGAMTYSNYGTGQTALYDRAVLPRVRFLFSRLGNVLFPRFGDTDGDLVLTFDDKDIPALESRRIENTKSAGQIGVLKVNELRDEIGYEQVDGGDVILRPASDVPALDNDGMDDNETLGVTNGKEKETD